MRVGSGISGADQALADVDFPLGSAAVKAPARDVIRDVYCARFSATMNSDFRNSKEGKPDVDRLPKLQRKKHR